MKQRQQQQQQQPQRGNKSQRQTMTVVRRTVDDVVFEVTGLSNSVIVFQLCPVLKIINNPNGRQSDSRYNLSKSKVCHI